MKKNKKNNCKINKCMETKNYVKISNEVIQSKEISLTAKGLLVYILSLPSDWFLIKGDMYKQLGMTRRAVEKAFNELVAAGFIVSNKTQTQGGWSYSYEIFSRFPNGINIQNNDAKEEEFVDNIPTDSEIEYENKEVNDNNTMSGDNEIPNIPTEEIESEKDTPREKTKEELEAEWEAEVIRTMPKEFAKKPTLADYGYPEEPTIVLRKKPIEKEDKDDDEEDYMKCPVWSDEEEALHRLHENKTLGTYSKELEDMSILKSVVVEKEIEKHNLKEFLMQKGYSEDFFKLYEEHKNGKEVNDPVFRTGLKWYDKDLKEFELMSQAQ